MEMDPELVEKLKVAPNVREMLLLVLNYYKLEDCVPGIGVRPALINGLKSAVKITQPKKR